MKSLLRAVLVTILSIFLLTQLVTGVTVANTWTLIVAGLVLALLNATVRPFLKILFLPINLITLGLFGWLINVFVILITTWLVPGFQIHAFTLLGLNLGDLGSLIAVAFGLSLMGTVLSAIF